jgi:hypothetical protein
MPIALGAVRALPNRRAARIESAKTLGGLTVAISQRIALVKRENDNPNTLASDLINIISHFHVSYL